LTSDEPASTSADEPPGADFGLLSPVRAGGAAEAATGDAAYLAALLEAEAALARAQARVGMIPQSAADAICSVIADMTSAPDHEHALRLRDIAARARVDGNPVIPAVADLRAAVSKQDPEAAEFVHCGATSQDILDTATMLVSHRVLGLIAGRLDAAAGSLARLAGEHRETPMAARTITQHAVPTTFGLKAAGWRHQVLAARRRIAACRESLPAQLGGAAGTVASFQHAAWHKESAPHAGRALGVVAAFAEENALAEPLLPWHSLRTPIADLAAALAFASGALGKIAADVLVLSRTEIGEVREGGGGQSSAMPQKRNPIRAVLVSAAARQVPALATVLFGALAAEDERAAGAWHAEWQPLREALRLTGGAAEHVAALVETLEVDPERMRANLELSRGGITAEHIAVALAPVVGRSKARQLAAEVARHPGDFGQILREVPELAQLPTDTLRALTDPAQYLGAAAELVDRALREEP
jgi:3-carboxy-cis,cis-muconate cycloisomerase